MDKKNKQIEQLIGGLSTDIVALIRDLQNKTKKATPMEQVNLYALIDEYLPKESRSIIDTPFAIPTLKDLKKIPKLSNSFILHLFKFRLPEDIRISLKNIVLGQQEVKTATELRGFGITDSYRYDASQLLRKDATIYTYNDGLNSNILKHFKTIYEGKCKKKKYSAVPYIEQLSKISYAAIKFKEYNLDTNIPTKLNIDFLVNSLRTSEYLDNHVIWFKQACLNTVKQQWPSLPPTHRLFQVLYIYKIYGSEIIKKLRSIGKISESILERSAWLLRKIFEQHPINLVINSTFLLHGKT